MRRSLLLAPALLAAAVPAAADAATLTTDRPCYLQRPAADGVEKAPTVKVSGIDFAPTRPYSVALDGTPLPGGTGQTDDAGAMTGTFGPVLGTDQLERTFALAVTTDAVTASTSFTVTRFNADFSPQKGDPARLRVRFSVHGFNLKAKVTDPDEDVWLHYIRPNGKRKKSVRIGRTTGPCGKIERTNRRPLFPFKAERGTWRLQFDTSRKFRKGTTSSPFAFYAIGVRIRKAS